MDDHYIACLDLNGRSCLVVGSGAMAQEKVDGLRASGANVTSVAPADYCATDLDAEASREAGTARTGKLVLESKCRVCGLEERLTVLRGRILYILTPEPTSLYGPCRPPG